MEFLNNVNLDVMDLNIVDVNLDVMDLNIVDVNLDVMDLNIVDVNIHGEPVPELFFFMKCWMVY